MGLHFFKIINDYIIEDRRLELPKKFVGIFGEELGKAGLIEDPMGKIWPVELWKAEGEIYFQSGWQAFMEYFSIGVAHFLIFRYEGDSHFHVSICDMTACEIDYPCLGEDVDESHPERVSAGEKDHSMENMDVPFGCATRRTAHTAANRAGPSCKRNRCEDYHKAGDSVKRNKPDGFGENVCKPWVFRFKRQLRLHVPCEFTRSFLKEAGDNFVTLKDSTGRQWHVGYTISAFKNKAIFYKGWHDFVLENHLKVGDACVFELVGIDNLEMKVNIIRVSPDVV
ncbi:hypothetical protein MKW94_007009 [Papaver nudicaule]|uniref:TF-B3 domain-containing protein n=1 Tax=Papaver nudicaule TaxID=74823 RepID=A0AA41VPC3_PAPNU|nr:hypothetical protein [Papaver nudicaule]